MKVFIHGLGGYFDSVVLPVLSNKRGISLYLSERRLAQAKNYSKFAGKNVFLHSADINYDYYLFLGAPQDIVNFLDYVPYGANVWLEKPIFINSDCILYKIQELIECKKLNVHVGLSRNEHLINVSTEKVNSITFYSEKQYGWKGTCLNHHGYFFDSIHWFHYIHSKFGKLDVKSFDLKKDSLHVEFKSDNTKLAIFIRKSGDDYALFDKNKISFNNALARKLFEINFQKFTNMNLNYLSAIESHLWLQEIWSELNA